MLRLIRWIVLFRRLGRICIHRYTRYMLAWLVAVLAGTVALQAAWRHWEDSRRNDGCGGHTSIDFGSSYMMGRMLVKGQGQFLYDRNHLRNVLTEAYPREDEDPTQLDKEPSDAEWFMSWIMGSDSDDVKKTYASCTLPLAAPDGLSAALLVAAGKEQAWTEEKMAEAAKHRVGGPLYPPINALVAAPLGLFRPLTAYHLRQYFDLFLVLLTAAGISVLSSGRLWMPVAATILLCYPGYFGNLHLAQTSCLALTMLVWGWVFLARGRPLLGGAVWGLLAFKPVWAVSFFAVLLLTRRWRACVGMLGMGLALALATLPFVGLNSWWDWLEIGREATFWYKIDSNWIHLSRDLLSMPRRYLLDWNVDYRQRDRLDAAILGWSLLAGVAFVTIAVALWRWREVRSTRGPKAAFLLLGGWLCCFHFMYYDVLLSYLPVMLLLVNPHLYLRPRRWLRQALEWERRLLAPRKPALVVSSAGDKASAHFHKWRPPLGDRSVSEASLTGAAASQGQLAVLRLRTGSPFGWIRNPLPVLVLVTLLFIQEPLQMWDSELLNWPLDTYFLIVVWAGCGVAWAWRQQSAIPKAIAEPRCERMQPAESVSVNGEIGVSDRRASGEFIQLSANVGGAHEGLADQDRLDAGLT
jgi:arabinofuranan 3-O-arabinosyltransferase